MRFWSSSFADGGIIPERFALGCFDPKTHVRLADNVSPHLGWADLPAGTESLALLVVDIDVPSRGDDVDKQGRAVPADLTRVDFFHCVLVDIPPDAAPLAEGELARGVTARGKPAGRTARGARQGLNDYTGWFRGDPAMEGQYHGYDGPCPPWNDSIVHRYRFTLYALDLRRCPVEGSFTGEDVRKVIAGHVLEEASFLGRYTINRDAR